MLPSSRFYYNTLPNKEELKGATSAAFAFAAIYEDKRCTLAVDGKKAKRDCIVRYINKLRKVKDAFTLHSSLPRSFNFQQADSCNEGTLKLNMLRTQYMAHVLHGWFERARCVLNMHIKAARTNERLQYDRIMSVDPFVPESKLLQSAWDWAEAQVRGFRRTHTPGKNEVPKHIKFLMRCVDEIARPDDGDLTEMLRGRHPHQPRPIHRIRQIRRNLHLQQHRTRQLMQDLHSCRSRWTTTGRRRKPGKHLRSLSMHPPPRKTRPRSQESIYLCCCSLTSH